MLTLHLLSTFQVGFKCSGSWRQTGVKNNHLLSLMDLFYFFSQNFYATRSNLGFPCHKEKL